MGKTATQARYSVAVADDRYTGCASVPLAKRGVADWPVIGAMARQAGTIFIERDNLRSLPVTVAELAHALRSGCSVLVFPEGSTWCGREMGVFRRAAPQAAPDADAPVRPVTISYSTPAAAARRSIDA